MLSVFLFKQKTAYEMRISDWSSDVCSSDLDRQQCVTLFGAGALVDKGRALSLALMDRPRPSEDGSDVQARKVNIAMRPLVNCHSENSLAMTLVRKSTELAVATIFTVAVRKFPTFKSPVGHSARPHDRVKRTRTRARPNPSISEKHVGCLIMTPDRDPCDDGRLQFGRFPLRRRE